MLDEFLRKDAEVERDIPPHFIEAACAAIRKTWSAAHRRKARGLPPKDEPWSVPTVSLDSFTRGVMEDS